MDPSIQKLKLLNQTLSNKYSPNNMITPRQQPMYLITLYIIVGITILVMIINSTILYTKFKQRKLMVIPEGINNYNSVEECKHSKVAIDEKSEEIEFKKSFEDLDTKHENNRVNSYTK